VPLLNVVCEFVDVVVVVVIEINAVI
jgi:hypothetical protein